MRRSKLLVLEKLGLVQETSADCGYAQSFSSDGVSQLPLSGDPVEDEKLRVYMIRKARDEAVARARRIARLRKLARMDFKMVGGVAPVGFSGSGGGSAGGSRAGSMSARS
jgi:hypothetical protein